MRASPVQMVDVGSKPQSRREAIARGEIRMSPKALRLLRLGHLPKGDALSAARIAGILAAKRVSTLIPLCHSIELDCVEMHIEPLAHGVEVRAIVRSTSKTGVEMEALTAVSIACLTLYDMAKSVDRTMSIGPIVLEEKKGGRSGHFRRSSELECGGPSAVLHK